MKQFQNDQNKNETVSFGPILNMKQLNQFRLIIFETVSLNPPLNDFWILYSKSGAKTESDEHKISISKIFLGMVYTWENSMITWDKNDHLVPIKDGPLL